MRHSGNTLTPSLLGPMVGSNAPVYATGDLVIIFGVTPGTAAPMLRMVQSPQHVLMGRFVCIKDGSAQFNINLIPYRLSAGDILVIPRDTYIEIPEISPDCCLYAMSLPDEENLIIKTTHLKPFEADFTRIIGYIDIVWGYVHREEYSEKAVDALRKAISEDLAFLSAKQSSVSGTKLSLPDDLFRRFQDLIGSGEDILPKVDAYAEKLFVTPNYLSAVVKDKSGRTVMQWINSRILLEAKVLLLHSDAPVYEIADRLGFSSTTFFCRFFRRETGVSPLQYRKQ